MTFDTPYVRESYYAVLSDNQFPIIPAGNEWGKKQQLICSIVEG